MEHQNTAQPTWTQEMKISHLGQLYEESRYYRTFHHTIFSIGIAFYSGLMILQANILAETQGKILSLSGVTLVVIKYVVPLLVFLIFPALLTYIFINWHLVQGFIRDKIVTLQKELGFPQEFRESEKYQDFDQKTYAQRIRIGKGHWLFIICLWTLVIANSIIFCTIL